MYQKRIQFKNNISFYFVKYENEINLKYKNDTKMLNLYLNRSRINYNNFLLFNSLKYIKYNDAINLYKEEILNKEINDVTKIILLFFPFILKSNKIKISKEHLQLDYFDWHKLKFIDYEDEKLNNLIKDFFINYAEVKPKINIHRREMMNYLEAFLHIYTENEKISQAERKEVLLLHYFRPFIRPEEYFSFYKIKDNLL